MKKKHTWFQAATLAAAALLCSTHAFSQALPAEFEGTLSAVATNANGSLTLTLMGVTVRVPVGTPITTPTTTLTFAQLTNTAPLPNRTQAGFLQGTAIVEGTTNANGIVTAAAVFVEPSENVMLGVVTANNAGNLSINGVPIVMITDARMLAKPVQDVNGIAIIPASIPVGTGISAEGYYGNNVFNAFLVEADEGTPVNAAPQATIVRAQGRERTPNNARGDEVEVRGSVTLGHVAANVNTQNVRVFRVDGNTQTLLGNVTATRAADTPTVATFTFRVTTPPTNNAVLGTTPTTVRIVNTSPGALNASATSPVDVRN